MRIICIALFVSTFLSIASAGDVHVYDLSSGAMSTMKYSRHGSGKGKLAGPLPSGEIVSGEYVTVTNAAIGWGSVYSSVSGSGGYATGTGNGISVAAGGRRYGSAILTNAQQTVVNCEYVVGLNGHGTGYCNDNHEAKYKMMF
jgi:hypothetical protein